MADTPIPEAAAKPPVPRSWRWWLWLPALLLALGLLLAVLASLFASERGARWLVSAVNQVAAGHVHIGQVRGTLLDKLAIDDVLITTADSRIALDHATLAWQPRLLTQRRLQIDALTLGELSISSKPSTEPSKPPASLVLPVALNLQRLTLQRLLIDGTPTVDNVAASLSSDGRHHQLTLRTLGTPWFTGDGVLSLNGQAPFALQGQAHLASLAAASAPTLPPWRLQTALGGSLLDLSLAGRADGEPLRADFKLQIAPFASSIYGLLRRAELTAAGVNLQQLQASAPHTNLDIKLVTTPASNGLSGELSVDNHAAGKLPKALPLAMLTAQFGLDGYATGRERLHISRLDSRWAKGSIALTGDAARDRLALQAEIKQLDPHEFGAAGLLVNGKLALTGSPQRPALQANLTAGDLALLLDAVLDPATPPGPAAQATGQVADIRALQLRAGGGELALNGQFQLAQPYRFEMKGKLAGFDPAYVGKMLEQSIPSGQLNATLQAQGVLHGQPSGQASFAFSPSRFNGQPLLGKGRFDWQTEPAAAMPHFSGIDVALTLGSNKLKALGAVGRANDRLDGEFALPSLADFGPAFAGSLNGKLSLAGALAHPKLSGTAHAEKLQLPGNIRLASADLDAQVDALPERPADSPLRARLSVSELRVGKAADTLTRAQLQLDGTRAAHQLDVDAQGQLTGKPFKLTLHAAGALEGAAWRGRVSSLENVGDLPLKLNAPLNLQASANQVAVQGLDLAALGARLRLIDASWQDGKLAARGDAQDVSVASWLLHLPVTTPKTFTTDLVLAADFDLHADEQLKGSLRIEQKSGDVILRREGATARPVPLRLSGSKLQVLLAGNRVDATLSMLSAAFGSVDGRAGVQLEKVATGWQLQRSAPLQAHLHTAMPALAWAGPLLGPTISTAGKLAVDIDASGTIAAPLWRGRLTGDELSFSDAEQGVKWVDGSFVAQLEGDTLRLDQLRLKAGRGDLKASGRLALRPDAPEAALDLTFDHFAALARPDRSVTVSGTTKATLQNGKVQIAGRLTADEGRIEMAKTNVPTLGEDVIIIGRSPRVKKPAEVATPLLVQLDLDLGERFQFSGQGFEAKLGGSLRVRSNPSEPLAITGSVRIVDGRYAAYGQQLQISRGILTFQGAFDNPALDIEAIRPQLDPINPGVKISGTALAPQVYLIADQAMPDSEKLSWLILGRGSSGGKNDTDLLLAAAGALFSGNQSSNLRQQIAGRLGLDEINIGRSSLAKASDADSASSQVVSLGKRISDKAYLNYEQGLTGVGSIVKLTYKLSSRWSLVASSGTSSAVDLLYTLMFD